VCVCVCVCVCVPKQRQFSSFIDRNIPRDRHPENNNRLTNNIQTRENAIQLSLYRLKLCSES